MQTEIIKKDVADIEIKMEGNDPVVNSHMSSVMRTNFNQIRESYIEIRIPPSDTSTSSFNKLKNGELVLAI